MSRFSQPDHDPEQTKELRKVITTGKVRKLNAFLRIHEGSKVYVDDIAFALARGHMPEQVPKLAALMRKNFYD